VGQLTGNHFLTIHDEQGERTAIGRRLLYAGAQQIKFALAE
jgi:hypothetical protein